MTPARPSRLLLLVLTAAVVAGCSTPKPANGVVKSFWQRTPVVTPVLAVTDFENKASFHGQWNLGYGMAELLTAELLDTKRVEVLERQHIGDVLDEIVRQGHEFFRKEGRVERGRLKNARYLVRGVVTDFTVTDDTSGWFAVPHFTLFGRGSKARVAISVKVQDVASGAVLTAVKTDAEASASRFGGKIDYKDVAFGGDSFFRTPLGKATEAAIGKSVKKILRALPVQYWQGLIAEKDGNRIIVNGGQNVSLKVGQCFIIRGPPRDITDPATGNVIETVPGSAIGRIEIRQVNAASAYATLLAGEAKRGDYLEKVE